MLPPPNSTIEDVIVHRQSQQPTLGLTTTCMHCCCCHSPHPMPVLSCLFASSFSCSAPVSSPKKRKLHHHLSAPYDSFSLRDGPQDNPTRSPTGKAPSHGHANGTVDLFTGMYPSLPPEPIVPGITPKKMIGSQTPTQHHHLTPGIPPLPNSSTHRSPQHSHFTTSPPPLNFGLPLSRSSSPSSSKSSWGSPFGLLHGVNGINQRHISPTPMAHEFVNGGNWEEKPRAHVSSSLVLPPNNSRGPSPAPMHRAASPAHYQYEPKPVHMQPSFQRGFDDHFGLSPTLYGDVSDDFVRSALPSSASSSVRPSHSRTSSSTSAFDPSASVSVASAVTASTITVATVTAPNIPPAPGSAAATQSIPIPHTIQQPKKTMSTRGSRGIRKPIIRHGERTSDSDECDCVGPCSCRRSSSSTAAVVAVVGSVVLASSVPSPAIGAATPVTSPQPSSSSPTVGVLASPKARPVAVMATRIPTPHDTHQAKVLYAIPPGGLGPSKKTHNINNSPSLNPTPPTSTSVPSPLVTAVSVAAPLVASVMKKGLLSSPALSASVPAASVVGGSPSLVLTPSQRARGRSMRAAKGTPATTGGSAANTPRGHAKANSNGNVNATTTNTTTPATANGNTIERVGSPTVAIPTSSAGNSPVIHALAARSPLKRPIDATYSPSTLGRHLPVGVGVGGSGSGSPTSASIVAGVPVTVAATLGGSSREAAIMAQPVTSTSRPRATSGATNTNGVETTVAAVVLNNPSKRNQMTKPQSSSSSALTGSSSSSSSSSSASSSAAPMTTMTLLTGSHPFESPNVQFDVESSQSHHTVAHTTTAATSMHIGSIDHDYHQHDSNTLHHTSLTNPPVGRSLHAVHSQTVFSSYTAYPSDSSFDPVYSTYRDEVHHPHDDGSISTDHFFHADDATGEDDGPTNSNKADIPETPRTVALSLLLHGTNFRSSPDLAPTREDRWGDTNSGAAHTLSAGAVGMPSLPQLHSSGLLGRSLTLDDRHDRPLTSGHSHSDSSRSLLPLPPSSIGASTASTDEHVHGHGHGHGHGEGHVHGHSPLFLPRQPDHDHMVYRMSDL